MTLREVQNILDAKTVTGEDLLDQAVTTACGSDMMSDVLAFVKDHAVLITGLVNQQVVRTAQMMDMSCVIFVRSKQPEPETVALAKERGIVLMCTTHRMFTTCGLLYEAGLGGGDKIT